MVVYIVKASYFLDPVYYARVGPITYISLSHNIISRQCDLIFKPCKQPTQQQVMQPTRKSYENSKTQRILKTHCGGRITYIYDVLRNVIGKAILSKKILRGQRLFCPKNLGCRVVQRHRKIFEIVTHKMPFSAF